MSKTIIISNRLPVKISEQNGVFNFKTSEGGVATGLSSVIQSGNFTWIGWPGTEVPKKNEINIAATLNKQHLLPVFLSHDEIKNFYEGFSNEILWPVFHYMPTYAKYDNTYWNCYKAVNEKFFDAAKSVISSGDTIWIHDYQLLLLPALIRNAFPNASIGFFQHIPFPSFEMFRVIPWRAQLLNGMLGADLIGFHTYDDATHFLSSATRLLQLPSSSNNIVKNERSIIVESFPMGIDAEKFEALTNEASVKNFLAQLENTFGNKKLVLSIDRLDYSKGIPQRLEAFDIFLQKNIAYRGRISLYMIVVPSRDTVPQYAELRDNIDKLVGNINARFRTNDWTPIHYFYRSFSVEELSALFQFAGICLVTPLRDGMNLVCKEYIASRKNDDGVLILSEMAGASKELIDAIIVNPNNVEQMADALVTAINMLVEEQQRRMKTMRQLVKRYNVSNWVKVFMKQLKETKQTQQSLQTTYTGSAVQKTIQQQYAKAKKRLLLLDYDGTLVNFSTEINKAVPGENLFNLLEELSKDERNKVVIISGRQYTTLDEWFGKMKIDLIGEHGVWYKENGNGWQKIKGLDAAWKQDIIPLLETFNERTPGSFTEEKTYSLVWHYRRAENKLGETRAKELMNNLRYLIADTGLQILPGNKVVEIKNIEINKGKTALHYVHKTKYDFVLAIGDDTTDEDMFKALKDIDAVTIKVNSNFSAAKYFLKDPDEVISFLQSLLQKPLLTRMFNSLINLLPAGKKPEAKHAVQSEKPGEINYKIKNGANNMSQGKVPATPNE